MGKGKGERQKQALIPHSKLINPLRHPLTGFFLSVAFPVLYGNIREGFYEDNTLHFMLAGSDGFACPRNVCSPETEH
jgi:hypothetical protein